MKKQRKQLVILVLMLLLLVAGYFGVQQYNKAQANKEAEDIPTYAIDLASMDVTELSYTYEGVEYAFVFEENVWKCKDDKELSIIQSRLNTMADSVAKLAVESQIDNVTDLSVYGLEEPEKVITFVAGGTTYKIAIGDYNSMSGLDYININDSNIVYAVETTLGDAFDYTLEDLIEVVEEETEESAEDAAGETADSEADGTVEAEAGGTAGEVENGSESDETGEAESGAAETDAAAADETETSPEEATTEGTAAE